ncbi:MAG: TVP38/TMEM64 family protein [Verrucomicrobia bacterium]|nr:TVP38/TMEM64 family protein [Verrucomicrobiota bacterium]
MTESEHKNKHGWLKPVIILVIIAAMILAGKVFHFQEHLRQALAWIEGLGTKGYAFFVGIYVLACVLFVPGSILTLGSGAIYGVVLGSILVSLGSTIGAVAAFLIGRYFARNMIAKKIEGNARFAAIDSAVANEGWKIVGLTRLSPIFPFNLLNYAYGLTKVSLRDYVLASWIGMMPGTVMFVYVGSLAGDLASVGGEGRGRTPVEWALDAVGLLATVVVTVFVTRVARKALSTRIDGNEQG